MSSQAKWKLLAMLIVASAVLGVVGWQQFTPKPMSPTTITITPSVTTVTSTTAVASTGTARTFKLFGKIFFDYNGNGKQEQNEPAIAGVIVALDGVNRTATNSTGWYVIDSVSQDNHRIRPYAPRNFRYMCESAAEVRPVEEPYEISVSNDTRKDVGLMEGFLTLPFPSSVPIEITDHFDHDPGLDGMWWNGRRLEGSRGHSPPHTHPGIDFIMPKGTVLVAAVSGRATGINTEPGSVYWISFSIRDGYGMTYLHIDKPLVAVGTFVNRGQPVALSGDTGSPGHPHLEFQLWRQMPDKKLYCIDSYSPVAGVPKGAWIPGKWDWYPSDEEWISQGYWTKFNEPQYLE